MKKCPYCAEEIQDEAIKCKHCGSDLVSENIPQNQKKTKRNTKKIFRYLIVVFILSLIILIAFYLIYFRKNLTHYKDIFNNIVYKNQTGELSSQEIEKISKSLVFLECFDENKSKQILFGSGTLISKSVFTKNKSDSSEYFILTNGHVIKVDSGTVNEKSLNHNYCIASSGSYENKIGAYSYNNDFKSNENYFFTEPFDIALLKYNKEATDKTKEFWIREKELKEKILTDYTSCPSDKIVGKKVYILGYPGSTFNELGISGDSERAVREMLSKGAKTATFSDLSAA